MSGGTPETAQPTAEWQWAAGEVAAGMRAFRMDRVEREMRQTGFVDTGSGVAEGSQG